METPAITSLGCYLTNTEEIDPSQKQKRAKKKKKRSKTVEHKDKGHDFSLDISSLKTDATMKDPLHESPALTTLLSSQRIVELNSKKKNKKRERLKIKHNAIEGSFNGCSAPNDTFSSKTSKPALDMPSEHPVQYVSTDPVTRQSCMERDICQGENVEKEQIMHQKAAENSNGKCDFQEVRCNRDSFVANAECFAKKSVLEVVKLNVEQDINDKSSNLDDKSGFVNNASKVQVHSDCSAVYHFSGKFQYAKTYARRKRVNSSYGRTSGYLVNFNKEQTMRDHHKDDSHISNGPLAVGLTETETKLSSHSKISHYSLNRIITSSSKNKLLILDVNGLLADIVSYVPRGYKREPDLLLKRRKVYKRPFCDDFLQFCFNRFHVAIWSSRAKFNVDKLVEFLMGKSASKLLFCWNQSHCTRTKFSTVENPDKPLVLKELRKLWEKVDPGLPWEKREFNESNTLLLDDSPYKALVNPMYTAIFPYSYQYNDARDASLGPGGDLRVYLEGLATAENVQEYVSSNPFGQRAITESNPSWGYYRKVIEAVKHRQNARTSSSVRE